LPRSMHWRLPRSMHWRLPLSLHLACHAFGVSSTSTLNEAQVFPLRFQSPLSTCFVEHCSKCKTGGEFIQLPQLKQAHRPTHPPPPIAATSEGLTVVVGLEQAWLFPSPSTLPLFYFMVPQFSYLSIFVGVVLTFVGVC
jgi:hypothetical protein